MITVLIGGKRLLQLSPECEDTSSHLRGLFGDDGMTLLNSCLGDKEPACV